MECLQKINNSKCFAYYLLLLYLQKLKYMSMKLMIGNIVRVKASAWNNQKEPFEGAVVELYPKHAVIKGLSVLNWRLDELEGVPLTPEILKEYGFTPIHEDGLYPRKYWQHGEIEVALYPNLFAVEIAPGYTKAINYLHELQNIASIIFDQTITKA